MSRAPRAPQPAPLVPLRVLLCVSGAGGSALARALAAAGCQVETVPPGQLDARAADLSAHEAIVFDAPSGAQASARLGTLSAIDASERPALIALDAADAGGGPGAAREIVSAAREVALARAAAEIARLRGAVRFARDTAHDLAQPLTTILARAQLLLSKAGPDHPHHKAAEIIAQEAERLATTAERFSKLKEMAPLP